MLTNALPEVTGNLASCPDRDSNLCSDEKQRAVNGNAFDHSATRVELKKKKKKKKMMKK